MNNLCFGQRIDPQLGILQAWYTHGALDRICRMDVSDKVVCEYGAGHSTVWWSKKAKQVYAVDHSKDWANNINKIIGSEVVKYVDTNEGNTLTRTDYVNAFDGVVADIVIVDGIHRYECAEHAVKVLKPEILIIDNHQQDYVFICPALDELLKDYRMERYVQQDHKDHNGRPWATAIFFLR